MWEDWNQSSKFCVTNRLVAIINDGKIYNIKSLLANAKKKITSQV